MFELLLFIGLIVAAIGCRTFFHPLVRKLGGLLLLVASYLAGYFLTSSHFVGAAAMVSWFMLPWVELLTRIRRLRLPMTKRLEHRPPPSRHRFPHLDTFTEQIEAEGFEFVEDTGWEWDGLNQFYRIFYNAEQNAQATICMNEQDQMAFAFVAISSRTKNGHTWRTWNYPFSYTMELSPDMHLNRVADAESFSTLWRSHQLFLRRKHVAAEDVTPDNPENLPQQMEEETRAQISHNLNRGLISASGDDTFKYSWRGLVFLWGQFVKDMVKLS